MNISLTSTRQAALERAAKEQSTPEQKLTADDLAAKLLNSACDSYMASHSAADKEAMAADQELMEVGLLATAATPERRAAAIAAARDILES